MLIFAILLLFLRNSKTKPVNSSLDENRNTIDEYDSEEEDFSSDEIEDHEIASNAAEIKEKVTIRATTNHRRSFIITEKVPPGSKIIGFNNLC